LRVFHFANFEKKKNSQKKQKKKQKSKIKIDQLVVKTIAILYSPFGTNILQISTTN
jgi:accessory gene regulator protein AgrB